MRRGRGGALDASDPLAALAREAVRPYYLLHGEETFLVDRALAMLRARLLPAGGPGTWHTVWADQDGERLGPALEDLASPPLFGGPQVLVVRRAEALGDEAQTAILDRLPTLGAGGSLVLVARTADQRRRLFAACLRSGAAYAFPAITDRRAAVPWVGRLARERGHEVAPAAAEELVDRTGPDLGAIASEVEKISLYAGPGKRIDASHVRAVVAAVRPHGVEELTDRLGRADLAGAAHVLRRLFAEGEPPIRVVAFLAANLRRALHVAELAEAGLDAEEIGRRLGMPGWLVAKQRGRGRARDLAHALVVLERLDLELKSSRPAAAVFEAALLEIASEPRRPAAG
ncbi:MAG TPA: DNA polymerase III subunit delta [Candidatus Binatia bacterium]|nr:DNA polymerase III subunit delta [Candidatus Binatia bacterium]